MARSTTLEEPTDGCPPTHRSSWPRGRVGPGAGEGDRATRSTFVRVAVVVVVAVAASGCGGPRTAQGPPGDPFGPTGAPSPPRRPDDSPVTTVVIQAQNRTEATVRIVARGSRRSDALGSVAPYAQASFRTRWFRRDDLVLEIALSDGRVCVTDGVTVEPAEEVALAVFPDPGGGPDPTAGGVACQARLSGGGGP